MARTMLVEFHDGTTSPIQQVEQIDDSDAYSVKFYARDLGLLEKLSQADIKSLFPMESDEKPPELSPLPPS